MYKEFIKLTIPNILTNLTVPLVSLVDVILMGHMESPNYIVAIGLSVAIFNFIYWAFGFLRMGTTGLVAQAFGRHDHQQAKQTLVQGITIALTVGVLLVLLQKPILLICESLLSVSNDSLGLIENYFDIRIIAAPVSVTIFVINGWLLGIQRSNQALVLAVVINVINILVSYTLVEIVHLGIRGVGIGTVVAQVVGLMTGIYFIFREYDWSWLKLFNKGILSITDSREFLNVNADLFIRTICLLFALIFFKINAAEVNLILGAANLLLVEFIGLSAYGVDGLAFSAEAISGKYFGVRNKGQLKKSIKVAFQLGLLIGALGTAIFYLFGNGILNLLTDQADVIAAANPYLIWVIIAPLVHSVAFIWDGIFIGCSASKQMKISLILATFGVFLPSYYLLSSWYGNHGIWLSLTLFMAARGVILSFMVEKGIYARL